jgi:hypothetical protein
MSNDQLLAYGTLLLAVFTAGGIIVAIWVYRRQCNAQVFIGYTKRYADIMNMFPVEGRKARLDLSAEPPARTDALSLAVLRYLNLCSEEFYLWKKGYLSRRVWRIWEAELRRTLASPLIMREWASLREEFRSYPEFLDYVEKGQRQAPALQTVQSAQVPPLQA